MKFQYHDFTRVIIEILDKYSSGRGIEILEKSELLNYINIKTKAANQGSKARAGFANHYAIYVLVEDYIKKGYLNRDDYTYYEGAKFIDLFNRQRELPFGSKLQNHALNHRLNQEFKKFFPTCDELPVIRDAQSNRYWINERLIKLDNINIAKPIIDIINSYIDARKRSFTRFMEYCQKIIDIQEQSPEKSINFIKSLFNPNTDARIFEIASFSVLKQYYVGQEIYWGWNPLNLHRESLILYKTGRTNANDGGIDFVMKPLGRFFQVTEVIDAGKYFLDIDKVQCYPVTFVVKTNEGEAQIIEKISIQARRKYNIEKMVNKYISSIEEIINIPKLIEIFESTLQSGKAYSVIDEIILQSRIEFNMEWEERQV